MLGRCLVDQGLDAEVNLLAQRLRDPFERELGHAVGTEPRRSNLTTDAGPLHHGPATLAAHVRQTSLGQGRRPEEVQLEQVAQLLLSRLLQGTDLA